MYFDLCPLLFCDSLIFSHFLIFQWVWAPLLDNLMAIGYDSNMIYFANYDWRLSRMRLEERDGFWSRTKFEIELRVKMSGQKAVLMGHSMGSNMIFYFLQWVTSNHPKAWCVCVCAVNGYTLNGIGGHRMIYTLCFDV